MKGYFRAQNYFLAFAVFLFLTLSLTPANALNSNKEEKLPQDFPTSPYEQNLGEYSENTTTAVIPQLPGWPQSTGDYVRSSPVIADLDGDGFLEIVVGSYDSKVYAWHANGTLVAGWPQSTGDYVESSPAIADLDGDDSLEIVVGSLDGKIYAWHADGTPVAGWPQNAGSYVYSSPAIADLDGDGSPEIVVGSQDHKVYAWHADGTPVTGWPQSTGSFMYASPAIADLDGDGSLEIVIGTYDKKVYAWHADGTLVIGWPQSAGGWVYSSPAIADLDGDGSLEIVVGSWDRKGAVYAWHVNGTLVTGWPKSVSSIITSSPVIADFDGDGSLEVVVGSFDRKIYAWHANGTLVTGWPQIVGGSVNQYVHSSPAIADLDGDGSLEIVIGADNGMVYAWHADGTLVTDWPQSTSNRVYSSPAIADLDGDGSLEIVVGSDDSKVYAWTLPSIYSSERMPWPMFHHDSKHTGSPFFPPFLNPIGNKTVAEEQILNFTVNAYDSNGDTITYSASNLPSGATFNPATGSFVWTPGFDQSGSYTDVHFEVSDGTATDSEDITITVTNTNRPPVLNSIGSKTMAEGQELILAVNAIDPDGDSLVYSASNLPAGAIFDAATKIFAWNPDYTQAGSYANVHFEVSDGTAIDSEDITITVTNTNRPPALDSIRIPTIAEGQELILAVNAIDPDGDSLVYSASNLPAGAIFDAATKIFAWNPDYTQAGVYPNIHFEVSDGIEMDNEDITIAVTNVNQPPVLASIDFKTISEGTNLSFTIGAADLDNDPLTYSATNLPSGAAFDANTKTFSWTPDYAQAGSYPNVHFEVSDGTATDSEDITITVTNTNRPPMISIIPNQTVRAGSLLTVVLPRYASDPDGDRLVYSASRLIGGMTLTSQGLLSWVPKNNQVGGYAMQITATDIHGLSTTRSFTVNVTSPPPQLNFDASPTLITLGQSSALSWNNPSMFKSKCTASGGWQGPRTVVGNQIVAPKVTTTYTLSCDGSASGHLEKSVTVTVQRNPPPPSAQ